MNSRLLRVACSRGSLSLLSAHSVNRGVPRKHCLMLCQHLVTSTCERASFALVETVSNYLEQILRQKEPVGSLTSCRYSHTPYAHHPTYPAVVPARRGAIGVARCGAGITISEPLVSAGLGTQLSLQLAAVVGFLHFRTLIAVTWAHRYYALFS